MIRATETDPFGLSAESNVDETGIRWSNHTPPRPYIKMPDGREVLFSRVTSWLDVLDDRSALQAWRERIILSGLALDHALTTKLIQISVDEALDDRKRIGALAAEAFRAGDGHLKAEKGTNLHSLSELADQYPLDRFSEIPWPIGTTEADIADMLAYRRAIEAHGIVFYATETRVVLDDLKVTGTFDRLGLHEGKWRAMDIKSGRVDYARGKMAMQLALYAHGQVYDPATGERRPFKNIDHDCGLIIHVAQGEARCDIYKVDLRAGWEAVQLARQVREYRKTSADCMELVVSASAWGPDFNDDFR